jgi:3-oxoacyl-[acyl-carrier protein] reductase
MVAAASKGMGRACALGLAREGASVSICARGDADLQRTAGRIAELSGSPAIGVPVDLRKPTEIQAWADRTIERFGGIDILVTNAGGPPPGLWASLGLDEPWQRAFDLTLLSTIRQIRAVVPSMRARGGGRIINIQSSSVKEPIDGLILSNTIRPGVVGLSKSLSRELAADGILINTVAPGRIATERLRTSMLEQARSRGPLAALVAALPVIGPRVLKLVVTRDIPLKRLGTPAEFADMVVFLASDRASYVTGSTIAVDGGLLQSLW